MPKVTIYVGKQLKDDMDRMGDAVNWSNVAQTAFSTEIRRKAWKMMDDKMQAAMERLKSSKADTEANEELVGKERGRHWAMNIASYEDLRAISQIDLNDIQYDGILPSIVCNKLEDRSFWREYSMRPNEEVTDTFVHGFVEGATEFFDEVSDRI